MEAKFVDSACVVVAEAKWWSVMPRLNSGRDSPLLRSSSRADAVRRREAERGGPEPGEEVRLAVLVLASPPPSPGAGGPVCRSKPGAASADIIASADAGGALGGGVGKLISLILFAQAPEPESLQRFWKRERGNRLRYHARIAVVIWTFERIRASTDESVPSK